jgi:hypothetical protein
MKTDMTTSKYFCVCHITPMLDYCLKLSKIKALKMLDLQTESAIDSDNL